MCRLRIEARYRIKADPNAKWNKRPKNRHIRAPSATHSSGLSAAAPRGYRTSNGNIRIRFTTSDPDNHLKLMYQNKSEGQKMRHAVLTASGHERHPLR
jgi:hypothetical protein